MYFRYSVCMGKGKLKSDIENSKGDVGNYIEIRYRKSTDWDKITMHYTASKVTLSWIDILKHTLDYKKNLLQIKQCWLSETAKLNIYIISILWKTDWLTVWRITERVKYTACRTRTIKEDCCNRGNDFRLTLKNMSRW